VSVSAHIDLVWLRKSLKPCLRIQTVTTGYHSRRHGAALAPGATRVLLPRAATHQRLPSRLRARVHHRRVRGAMPVLRQARSLNRPGHSVFH